MAASGGTARARTETALQDLRQAVLTLCDQVDALGEGQARIQEGLTELRERLRALEGRMTSMEGRNGRCNGQSPAMRALEYAIRVLAVLAALGLAGNQIGHLTDLLH